MECRDSHYSEAIFEEMKAENFPKLMTGISPQIQESQNTPNRI